MDQFLRPPRLSSGRSDHRASTARVLRDRISAMEDSLDLLPDSPQPHISARQLVQVFDNGSMPTVTPRVFFTHPVLVSGAEAEGGTATLTSDTDTIIPVIFLGHAPSAGDYGTAYAVGGRWVSEQLTSSSACYLLSCSPCPIPRGDLTISWTNTSSGNGSATLTYFPATGGWQATCVDNGLIFVLTCTSGALNLAVIYFTSGSCPTGIEGLCNSTGTAPGKISLSASTCSPFSLTFTVNATDCPHLWASGNTQFVITPSGDATDPTVMACPVCFQVQSCCGSTAGAVLTVLDSMMSTVATVTLTGVGPGPILDIGSPGTYTVTVTGSGCVDYSESLSLTCKKAQTIVLAFPPAKTCCNNICTIPHSLTITDSLKFPGGLPASYYTDLVASFPFLGGVVVGPCSPGSCISPGTPGWAATGSSGGQDFTYVGQCSGGAISTFKFLMTGAPAGGPLTAAFDVTDRWTVATGTCNPFSSTTLYGLGGGGSYTWTP